MRRLAARILAAAMITAAMCGLFTGCASSKWQGTWNRTGDATYCRAKLEIFDVTRKGFTFDMTLYNGNVVGELEDCQALFMDRACTQAVYDVHNSFASITFDLNEKGEIEVFYMGGTGADNYIIEAEMFEFAAPAYITGNFVRGETTYLNSSFAATGMLSAEADAMVNRVMPKEMYDRCLDCFQYWEQWSHEKTGSLHDDELGAYLYYGWNQMQDMGGIIVVFDDDSVAVIISREDGSLVYYSDNHIYGSGDVYPLQIQIWMEEYYEKQKKN